jgi:CheY-like chemotaxis protein
MTEQTADRKEPKPVMLVVEDEPTNLKLLLRALEENYEVHGFEDPLQALARAVELQPAILVTDYRMPGLNGVELSQQIRARTGAFTCVLVTGYADIDEVARALESRLINRVIAKPWRPSELRAQVDLAFGLQKLENRRARPLTRP